MLVYGEGIDQTAADGKSRGGGHLVSAVQSHLAQRTAQSTFVVLHQASVHSLAFARFGRKCDCILLTNCASLHQFIQLILLLFVVRRLQELGRQGEIPLYVCSTDLQKAYDSVDPELVCVCSSHY